MVAEQEQVVAEMQRKLKDLELIDRLHSPKMEALDATVKDVNHMGATFGDELAAASQRSRRCEK